MQMINGNMQPDVHKHNKILIALVASIILFVMILLAFVLITTLQPKTLQVYIDEELIKVSEDTFVIKNNKVYVSIKDISPLIGYTYYNGEYNSFSEDNDKCYIESKNEIATFEFNSNNVYKTLTAGTIDYYTYVIDEPVQKINNKLYTTQEAIKTAANIQFVYNKEKNSITILTLDKLTEMYKQYVMKNFGYTGISTDFVNKKAILYEMIVIEKDGKYGVIDTKNNTLIGTKYEKIQFIENTEEFLATALGKIGLITKEGTTNIPLEYEEIKLLDKESRLYYVKKSDKFKGVTNRKGNMVIYVEYDEIGIKASLFPSNDIKNPMLLYNNCIPVKQNDYWGLFDKEGTQIQGFNWESFGYVANTSKDKMVNNLLLIPSIEGIIVCKDGKYGIVNSLGNLLTPCNFDRIYSITSENKETIYLEFQGKTVTLDSYLKANGIIPVEQETKPQQNTVQNNQIVTNEATNNVLVKENTVEIISNEVITNSIANEISTSANTSENKLNSNLSIIEQLNLI